MWLTNRFPENLKVNFDFIFLWLLFSDPRITESIWSIFYIELSDGMSQSDIDGSPHTYHLLYIMYAISSEYKIKISI